MLTYDIVYLLTHKWYKNIIEVHTTKDGAYNSRNEYIAYNPNMKKEDFEIIQVSIKD